MPLSDDERQKLEAWVWGHACAEHRNGKACKVRKASKMKHDGLHQGCDDVDEMRKLVAKA